MPSKSKHQAAYFEKAYNDPKFAKSEGLDPKMVEEWVMADRVKGTKKLPTKVKKKK